MGYIDIFCHLKTHLAPIYEKQKKYSTQIKKYPYTRIYDSLKNAAFQD